MLVASQFRVCLLDMNQGCPNQAMRCFGVILESFFERVAQGNPHVHTEVLVVQPRNQPELPPPGYDLYIASGGPGSPFEHDHDRLFTHLRNFFDRIVDANLKAPGVPPALFGVCYSFELLVRHFAVAAMTRRKDRKFGVMPVYMTEAGQKHPLTAPFGDRLFAFEHRNWEAVDLDQRVLRDVGGCVLACESRDGISKGRALLALEFAPGVEGTQFHPEADREGVISWVSDQEEAHAFVQVYGPQTYQRMIKTLDNPQRVAKTFALMLPGWLKRKFNAVAEDRGWNPLSEPSEDVALFAGTTPPASSLRHSGVLKAAALMR